jgi:hypothetical protein
VNRKDLTTVDFRGAKLVAIPGDTPATTLVAMRRMTEGMGWPIRKTSAE